jgi:ATP-binding cassette subfamily B protein
VILLDEPTSALDAKTEAEILETLVELKGSHTVILITHRESVWKHCDRVFRFDKGSMEEIRVESLVSVREK